MLFSVTIPTFKRQFLQECIESVLAQTFCDFELIIVNDASPEDIDSVVSLFGDPRIRYYNNEKNCGAVDVVDNWNICLGFATGDYVICMGDDDKLLPNCLEEYAKLIEQFPGLGVYHAWTEIIDENSNVVRMQEARPLHESVYSMMWHRWNGRVQFIGDFLFDTKLLKANGGFYKLPLAWGSDDISTYIAAKDTGIANMQVPGFQYRINSQTISKTSNACIKMAAINAEDEWYETFLAKEPESNDIIAYRFWCMLKKEKTKAMIKKRIFSISTNLYGEGFHRIIYWYNNRKRYNLSAKAIGYSVIEAIKHKYGTKGKKYE